MLSHQTPSVPSGLVVCVWRNPDPPKFPVRGPPKFPVRGTLYGPPTSPPIYPGLPYPYPGFPITPYPVFLPYPDPGIPYPVFLGP